MVIWTPKRIIRHALVYLATTLSCAAVVPTSLADEQDSAYVLDIFAEDLAEALERLSIATGVSILMFLEDVEGQDAPHLYDVLTIDQALATLLQNTDLEFTQMDNGAYVVFRPDLNAPQLLPTPSPLSKVTTPEKLRYMEPIIVLGFQYALDRANLAEAISSQLIEVLSSESIGQFPEQNVSEALQRMPGVQITRQNGEGSEINIRGLPSEFTRVEFDGRTTIVNVEESNPQRIGELSVFASDQFDKISVVKTPTSADIEGAVAGIIRLETPAPLDLDDTYNAIKTRLRKGELRSRTEPYFSGIYASQYFDKTLGVLVSGSLEQRDRSLDKFQNNVGWQSLPNVAPSKVPFFPSRLRQEIRSGTTQHANLNAKLQYRPNSEFELSINAHFTDEDRKENRSRFQALFAAGIPIEMGDVVPDGTLSEAVFQNVTTDLIQFHRETDVSVIGLSGKAVWQSDAWTVSSELVSSRAMETLLEDQVAHRTTLNGRASYSLGQDPRLPQMSNDITSHPLDALDLRRIQSERREIVAEESSFRIDGGYDLGEANTLSVQFGLRFAAAEFSRKQGFLQYDVDGLTYADGDPFLANRHFADGFGDANVLRQWPSINPTTLVRANTPIAEFSFDDPNLYSIREATSAGYGMTQFEYISPGKIQIGGNVGLRVTRTEYTGSGRVRIVSKTGDATQLIDNGSQPDFGYTDFLPSANLKIVHADLPALAFRTSLSRTIARPNIDRISPVITFNLEQDRITRGEPGLEPYRAWQADVSFRYGSGDKKKSALSFDLFFKDIDSFILPVTRTVENVTFTDFGIDSFTGRLRTFENAGSAIAQGVEFEFETPFTELPAPFSNLGLVANYTFTDSTFKAANGETSDLPGASRHAFNAISYFETDRVSLRLAYVYRDSFIVETADETARNTVITDAQGRLDLAFRYRWTTGLTLMLDGQNLTGERNYLYYDVPSRLEDHEFEGPLYSISMSYAF